MDKKNKAEKLKDLIARLESDAKKLPLADLAEDTVPPSGSPDADMMFIGEAAGYHEHVQRKPFVGMAGKLLTKLLNEYGMDREDVWITNVLKVRPPQNRDPLPEEIEAYEPYLDEEIRIIEPKVIVTLGRFSMAKFIPDVYISQVHGQARWIKWEDRKILIFPMYHPAAALRNGKVMEFFKLDFAKLFEVIKILNHQPTNNNEEDSKTETAAETKEEQQLQLI